MLIVLAVVCKVGRVGQKIVPESLPEPSSEHLKLVPERSRGSPGATSGPKVVPADFPRRLRRVPGRFPRQPGAIPETPAAASEHSRDALGASRRPFEARWRRKSGSSVPLHARLSQDVLAERIFDEFCSIFGWSARSSTLTKYRACQQK